MCYNCTNFDRDKSGVLLADATKFGKRHMCQLCDWSSINYLITDAYEPDSLNKTLPVTILSV